MQRILVCCPDSKRRMQGAGTGTENATRVVNRSDDEPEPGNVLPSIGNCGIMFANRIIGGIKTELFEFPWMALLQYKKGELSHYLLDNQIWLMTPFLTNS